MSRENHTKVESRNESFVDRTETRIWHEQTSKCNAYIAENCRCHGYDILQLAEKRSFADVLYLLFRGELPSVDESRTLEQLMILLINPGPRHPATRAAMNAAIGKTDPSHILPIGLTVLSGTHLGASEIEPAMRFLRKNKQKTVSKIAEDFLDIETKDNNKILPGFGSHFGSIEIMPQKAVNQLLNLAGNHPVLEWGNELVSYLNSKNIGWLPTGLAAAVFTDLGFNPKAGAGLYQLISAPGLLAHGVELANKPLTAMPFIGDENYAIEE